MGSRAHQLIASFILAASSGAILAFLSMSPPVFSGARYALFIAAISLVAVYVLWVFSHPTDVRAQLFYGAFVAFIVVFGVVYGSQWIDYRERTYPKIPVYAGILSPYPLIQNGEIVDDRVSLKVGRSDYVFAGPQLIGILSVLGQNQFRLAVKNGSIMISTMVRDDAGDIIAEIRNNEWKVAPPPQTWDRNYTDKALEVRNAKGDVVLQVQMRPNNVIGIQGSWFHVLPDGNKLRMVVSDGGEDCDKARSCHPQISLCGLADSKCNTIKPMFKYPSEAHLGEVVY